MTKTRNKLLGYALHFTSFLVESGVEPNKVILFGSVSRDEADDESDIDLFVDLPESMEDKVRSVQKIFVQTFGEKWLLKGVSNPLSVIVGNLESKKWKDLKRGMQSHGIVLYSKYTEQPKYMKPYIIFSLNFAGLSRANMVRLWRTLYGYTQRVGKKTYRSRGMLIESGGKKLEKSIIAVPSGESKSIKEFLIKHNVKFSVNEVWSDDL